MYTCINCLLGKFRNTHASSIFLFLVPVFLDCWSMFADFWKLPEFFSSLFLSPPSEWQVWDDSIYKLKKSKHSGQNSAVPFSFQINNPTRPSYEPYPEGIRQRHSGTWPAFAGLRVCSVWESLVLDLCCTGWLLNQCWSTTNVVRAGCTAN